MKRIDFVDAGKFAEKWLEKFENPNTDYRELTDCRMGEEMRKIGFDMDCGHACSERFSLYGKPFRNLEIFDHTMEPDIMLIGSAIYSQWYYFSHCADSPEEILKAENREWFVAGLKELLCETDFAMYDPVIFSGKLRKINIYSCCLGFGIYPLSMEIAQRVLIYRGGRVKIIWYLRGEKCINDRIESRRKEFEIDNEKSERIFSYFEKRFSRKFVDSYTYDCGHWHMLLTNDTGEVFEFGNSLSTEVLQDGIDLSDLVRKALQMPELFVFNRSRHIYGFTKIKMEYHRTVTTAIGKFKNKADGDNSEVPADDYYECLIIDRKSETLEHIQQIRPDCVIDKKYHVADTIRLLLDSLHFEYILNVQPGDVVEMPRDPENGKEYIFSVSYGDGDETVIKGTYDPEGFPEDVRDFMGKIQKFMSFYGCGEIFDSSLYKEALNKECEYIFCSVVFEDGGRPHYYLTKDDTIRAGDMVSVPHGIDGQETVGKIKKVECFAPYNAPVPIEHLKYINGRIP